MGHISAGTEKSPASFHWKIKAIKACDSHVQRLNSDNWEQLRSFYICKYVGLAKNPHNLSLFVGLATLGLASLNVAPCCNINFSDKPFLFLPRSQNTTLFRLFKSRKSTPKWSLWNAVKSKMLVSLQLAGSRRRLPNIILVVKFLRACLNVIVSSPRTCELHRYKNTTRRYRRPLSH